MVAIIRKGPNTILFACATGTAPAPPTPNRSNCVPICQPWYTFTPTGIALRRTREMLASFGGHAKAKAGLQRACFGEGGVRPDVPLLCYLGRIAHQKATIPLLS